MLIKKILVIIAISLLVFACGGGGGGGSNSGDSSSITDDSTDTPVETVTASRVQDSLLSFSSTPAKDEEVTLSLNSDVEGEFDWTVSSEPTGSSLSLSVSADTLSATFTPTVKGAYSITVTSLLDSATKSTSFYVDHAFAYDEAKLDGLEPGQTAAEGIAKIVNQSWVSSETLTEAQLTTLVEGYGALFTVIGYDEIDGLLIEYDESDSAATDALEDLKFQAGVSDVYNRTHVGEDAEINFELPFDGSNFDDGGDNWHLEDSAYGANVVTAWDYTTGSDSILVGITEYGAYTTHEDLSGRYSVLLTADKDYHGTGVSGVIGGIADNDIGVTGINQVSKLALSKWGSTGYKSLLVNDDVRVVNNSWGAMGNNSGSINKGFLYTRTYRNIALEYDNVLHVWAAGNDGADARTQNGAIHLNSSLAISKLDNVMVVAALTSDGDLARYSNYGSTIDIAAPTEVKSTMAVVNGTSYYYEGNSYGVSYGGGFNGTSAAAPMVTGVASLVFSLNPNFTAAEVKEIMVSSATRFATVRETGANTTAALQYQIPVLDAGAALEAAQEIVNLNVSAENYIADPFTAATTVAYGSVDPDYTVTSVNATISSSDDMGTTWTEIGTAAANSNEITVDLDETAQYHLVVAQVEITNNSTNESTTAIHRYIFKYTKVGVQFQDTVSLSAVADASIDVECTAGCGEFTSASGAADGSGQAVLYLMNGDYKIFAAKAGYDNGVGTLNIADEVSKDITVLLSPDTIGEVGSLSGTVLDIDNNPVEGASVRLSGGTQTNGYFTSAATDANGNYILSNISKTDTDGLDISSFTMEVSAEGYSKIERSDVVILAGKVRTENFVLEADETVENVIYSTGFESGTAGWTMNGMWNNIDLTNNVINNTLVDNGYTLLPPDEDAVQALLPAAAEGDYAMWYGEAATGSFIGIQVDPDTPLWGGTSTIWNTGYIISPSIDLTGTTAPKLSFKTWWEIESVNPNAFGFDIMEILISTDGGTSFSSLKKLNPYVDPNDEDRAPKPFSSGGFNRMPVWAYEEIDLTDYAGEQVLIKLNFSTNDQLYNGFRGWLIDSFKVSE